MSTTPPDPPTGYEWWPIEKVTTNPQGPYVQVIRDNWWITDRDAGVLMYRSPSGSLHPQCNDHRSIVEKSLDRFLGSFDKVDKMPGIIQLPLVLAPIRIEDYR